MSLVTDILKAELTDLAMALQAHGIPVIIGGGYGLLLRQKHIAESGVRTIRAVPEARSTSDLDIFLSMEIVTNAARMGALRDVLHGFGYAPVAGAEHYQFRREISYRGARRSVKVDLLAPPPRDLALLAKVRVDVRRIRPRTSQCYELHSAA